MAASPLAGAVLAYRNAYTLTEGADGRRSWRVDPAKLATAHDVATAALSTEASPLGAEPGATGIDRGRDEQITQPSHDDEGLVERLEGFRQLIRRGLLEVRDHIELEERLDQAANTISRLEGERDDWKSEYERRDNDVRDMLDKFVTAESRSLQLEAEIKELRSGLEKIVSGSAFVLTNAPGGPAICWDGGDPYAKARSLLSPSQDVGLSSARSSRDARSSTRPEGPCSDEGGEGG